MGAVYSAFDRRLNRRVAIKHVPPEEGTRHSRRRRFRRESKILARLSHPAIVQIFDIVDNEAGDWIVMELVEGPTLAELVTRGPLPVDNALVIARRVAEGLAEAHDQGILHRDLKTENVILHPSGRPKILDFGLAKASWREGDDSTSVSARILGTPRAMSPEQARGLPLDARSDLFSLGVLLYEMTTAERPFEADTFLDTLNRIAGHPHVPARQRNPRIPVEVSKLIDRLLEKSPELRPQDAREVVELLTEIERSSKDGAESSTPVPELADCEEETSGLEPVSFETEPSAAELVESDGVQDAPVRPRRDLWKWVVAALTLVLATVFVSQTVRDKDGSDGTPAARTEAQGMESSALDETDNYELFQAGMGYLDRLDKVGYLDQAIAAFEAALARDDRSAAAHAGLAIAYRERFAATRDPLWLEQALAVAEQSVRLDQHLALARVALGMAYSYHGRYSEALQQLETALQLEPSNAAAHRGIGEVHRRQGDFDQAVAAYEEAVRTAPQDRAAHDQLGMLHYRAARYEQAEAQILKSLELAPDRAPGYRDLSAIYYMQGRLPEAAESLQKALTIRPEHSLYSNLGTVLFAQGLYPPAAKAFEEALEHGGGQFYLYWANLADAYRQMAGHETQARESYARAIELLRGELEKDPGNTYFRSRRALYQAKRGAREAALAELEEVGRTAGLPTDDLYRIAVAYEICDEREKALAALAEALAEGYSPQEVRSDPELFELRSDPRYQRLSDER